MQTINNDVKIKQNQTETIMKKVSNVCSERSEKLTVPFSTQDAGTTASTWDMYDTYESMKQAESTEGKYNITF